MKVIILALIMFSLGAPLELNSNIESESPSENDEDQETRGFESLSEQSEK